MCMEKAVITGMCTEIRKSRWKNGESGLFINE